MLELTLDLNALDPIAVSRVVETIRDVQGVEEVCLAERNAEEGLHKGLGADLVVKLADKALPEILRRLAEALKALFGLSGGPERETMTFGTAQGPVSFTYNPQHTSLDEAVTQMLRLLGRSDTDRD